MSNLSPNYYDTIGKGLLEKRKTADDYGKRAIDNIIKLSDKYLNEAKAQGREDEYKELKADIGAVYDEEAHSKMKFSIIGTLMILETAKTLWSENPEEGKMAAVLEAAKRYSREVEHSDENIELLEKLSRREGVFGLDSMLTGILN